jgi:hypothetical protein
MCDRSEICMQNIGCPNDVGFEIQCRHALFTTCQKNDKVQLHVIFFEKSQTLPNSHMQIFNVSITTVLSLENVSLNV